MLLAEANLDYDEGKYTSANTKAFEAYTLIMDAGPTYTIFQSLIIGFALALVIGGGLFNRKKYRKPQDFDEKLVKVELETTKSFNMVAGRSVN